MSSCKSLSSKIPFGNRFHGFTSDCVKAHFLFVPFEPGSNTLLVLPPTYTAEKSYPRTDLHPHSKCPHYLPLTAGWGVLWEVFYDGFWVLFFVGLVLGFLGWFFWLVFSLLFYWEGTAGKGEKGWMADFIGGGEFST